MIMKVVQYYIFSVEEMQLVPSDVKYTLIHKSKWMKWILKYSEKDHEPEHVVYS